MKTNKKYIIKIDWGYEGRQNIFAAIVCKVSKQKFVNKSQYKYSFGLRRDGIWSYDRMCGFFLPLSPNVLSSRILLYCSYPVNPKTLHKCVLEKCPFIYYIN
jgi:hypothetical protein